MLTSSLPFACHEPSQDNTTHAALLTNCCRIGQAGEHLLTAKETVAFLPVCEVFRR